MKTEPSYTIFNVAYISDLNTPEDIYDRLVSVFKVSDANKILFLKNKLKDIKKGRMRILNPTS